MNINIVENIILFVTVFFTISLIRLTINFLKALLSTPPEKLVLERRDLIYYGICVSFILTFILNNI